MNQALLVVYVARFEFPGFRGINPTPALHHRFQAMSRQRAIAIAHRWLVRRLRRPVQIHPDPSGQLAVMSRFKHRKHYEGVLTIEEERQ